MIRTVSTVVLEKVVSIVSAFSVTLLVANFGSVELLGWFKLMTSLQSLSFYLCCLGAPILIMRFGAVLHQTKNSEHMFIFILSIFLIVFVMFFAQVMMISFAKIGTYLEVYQQFFYENSFWIVLCLIFTVVSTLALPTATACGFRIGAAKCRIVQKFSFFLMVCFCIILYDLSRELILICFILSFGFELFLYSNFLRFEIPSKLVDTFYELKSTWKESLRFSATNIPFQFAHMLREVALLFWLMGYFHTIEDVGLLSVGILFPIAARNFLPVKLIGGVILVKMASYRPLSTNKKNQRLQNVSESLIKINTILLLPLIFFLVIFSEDLIILFFGVDYVDSIPILIVASICLLFMSASDIFYPLAQAVDRTRYILLSSIWSVPGVVFSMWAINNLSLELVYFAWQVPTIFVFITLSYLFRKDGIVLGLPWRFLGVVILFSVPFCFLALNKSTAMVNTSVLLDILLFLICLSCYAFFIFWSRVLGKFDRRFLETIFVR